MELISLFVLGFIAFSRSCAALNSTYDFIIVGGGTAGLTMAARLTENSSTSVLVLEYGGSPDLISAAQIPGGDNSALGTQIDWAFGTSPQAALLNRTVPYNRGRCLGGSSAINGLTYTRGSSSIYDNWAAMGNDGWAWNEVYPYFQKSTRFIDSSENNTASRFQGHDSAAYTNGPIGVAFGMYVPPVTNFFLEAVSAIGLNHTEDLNAGRNIGATMQMLITNGTKRVSAYAGYYVPNRNRSNLEVVTYASVQQILLSASGGNVTATGVVSSDISGGATSVYMARKEVIIAAGVFKTPQLLMLSGIGPAAELEKVGVEVVVANENVGKNLQDHPEFSVIARVDPHFSFSNLQNNVTAMQLAASEYAASGGGPLASTPSPGFAFEQIYEQELIALGASDLIEQNRTNQAHVEYNLELGYYPILPYGIKPTNRRNESYISLSAILVAPDSTGTVTVMSNQMSDAPVINPGWLSSPRDVGIQVRNVKKLRSILSHPALANVTVGPDHGEVVPGGDVTSDEDLETYIRATNTNIYHAGGTCKMSPRENGGVVDSRLRVYGVNHLRVADTSIFPFVPDAHTQASAYMIGEKAADMIKQDWNL